jgi:hypothetical protein
VILTTIYCCRVLELIQGGGSSFRRGSGAEKSSCFQLRGTVPDDYFLSHQMDATCARLAGPRRVWCALLEPRHMEYRVRHVECRPDTGTRRYDTWTIATRCARGAAIRVLARTTRGIPARDANGRRDTCTCRRDMRNVCATSAHAAARSWGLRSSRERPPKEISAAQYPGSALRITRCGSYAR